MTTSAKCTYWAVQGGGVSNYEVRLQNTSPLPFSIYCLLFGWQFDVPITENFPLQNVVLTQAPPGWFGYLEQEAINWATNWQGSAVATGYIMPGQTGKFFFQSSTAPPPKLLFGCGFYDNVGTWGYGFNGTAHLSDPAAAKPIVSVPPAFNPWWWIETHGGLVPPGPPPPWIQQLQTAVTLAGHAGQVSPQLRARMLELALEQTSIAAATIKRELQTLK
jgi:hypothetical protein